MTAFPIVRIVALAACSVFGSANANLLTNGSFEQGTFSGGSFGFPLAEQLTSGSTTITGWTVSANEIAWYKTGQPPGLIPEDGQFAIDLTGFCDLGANCGQSGRYGGIQQSVATTIGGHYDLSFYGANYALNATQPMLSVTATDIAQAYTLPTTNSTAGTWTKYSFDFFADSTTTTINFSGLPASLGGASYLGLDNVNLDLVSTPPVPEPETYALMMAGLGIVGFIARRRTSKGLRR